MVEPAAQAILASYDPTVTHHTVIADTVGTNAASASEPAGAEPITLTGASTGMGNG